MFPKTAEAWRLAGLLAAMGVAAWGLQAPPSAGAGAPGPFLAAFSAQSSYDSNLLQNNQQALAGWEEELAGMLQWQQQNATSTVQLQYRPEAELVPAYPALNSLNQTAALQVTLQPAPRWSLQGSANAGYWERLPMTALSGAPATPGVAPLPLLPRTRAVSGDGQLRLGYALSPRSALQAYGGYSERRFPDAGIWSQSLRGVHGDTSGLEYTFTPGPRTQWGVTVGQQNSSIGHAAHLAAVSLMVSYRRALTPLTSLQLEAGPEYSQVHETDTLQLNVAGLPITITDRLYRVRTYPRLGASLTHQSRTWPWRFQVERQISSGGGALPFPVSLLTGTASLGRRLSPQWRLQLGMNAAQFQALAGGGLQERVRMGAASLELTRRLGRQMSVGFDYQYFLQRSSGLIPLTPAVNRSVGGVRLLWQWPPAAEGGM